jgi:pimeloyl-ACP methyl ester carboxylesterase
MEKAAIPVGTGQVEVDLGSTKIVVHTYKPERYDGGPLVVVFHGMLRNAAEYRDHSRAMADRFGVIIAAPEFDRQRFPNWKYNRGGLVRNDGSVAPRDEWTWSLIPRLANQLRAVESRPDLPFYLVGHSAGGQFVGRMTAFVETGAKSLVASNPSSWVFPDRERAYPYGFGKLPDEISNDEAMRQYLARPLTIYLGGEDNQLDPDLDTSADAKKQGENRLVRGRHVYDAARKLARVKGWDFRWRLVEAPGVGHDHEKMFDSPACASALFGPDAKSP